MDQGIGEYEKGMVDRSAEGSTAYYEQMKKELADKFTEEDRKKLPEYIRKEEQGYYKVVKWIYAGLIVLLVTIPVVGVLYFLSTILVNSDQTWVRDQSVPEVFKTLAIVFAVFVFFILPLILVKIMPKNGKMHIIRIGKPLPENEERLMIYARLEVEERRAKESLGRKNIDTDKV